MFYWIAIQQSAPNAGTKQIIVQRVQLDTSNLLMQIGNKRVHLLAQVDIMKFREFAKVAMSLV